MRFYNNKLLFRGMSVSIGKDDILLRVLYMHADSIVRIHCCTRKTIDFIKHLSEKRYWKDYYDNEKNMKKQEGLARSDLYCQASVSGYSFPSC